MHTAADPTICTAKSANSVPCSLLARLLAVAGVRQPQTLCLSLCYTLSHGHAVFVMCVPGLCRLPDAKV